MCPNKIYQHTIIVLQFFSTAYTIYLLIQLLNHKYNYESYNFWNTEFLNLWNHRPNLQNPALIICL